MVEIQNCSSFFFSFFLSFFLSSSSSSSLFSNQPSTLMQEVTQLKRPSIVRKFPKDGSFVLSLKQNYSLR